MDDHLPAPGKTSSIRTWKVVARALYWCTLYTHWTQFLRAFPFTRNEICNRFLVHIMNGAFDGMLFPPISHLFADFFCVYPVGQSSSSCWREIGLYIDSLIWWPPYSLGAFSHSYRRRRYRASSFIKTTTTGLRCNRSADDKSRPPSGVHRIRKTFTDGMTSPPPIEYQVSLLLAI